MRAWRTGRIELVVSETLLGELADVLARPKFAPVARDRRAVDFVVALRAGATLLSDPPAVVEPITRDHKDDYLVQFARSVAVDALVPGDRDLLEAGLADVNVMTPRAFIDAMERD